MTILFITADRIGSPTGGGLVCYHETEALKSLGYDLLTLSWDELNPPKYGMADSPFLCDHLAMNEALKRYASGKGLPRLVHVYSGTFSNTVRYFRGRGVPVSHTVDAHERLESIREFETLYGEYPFPHVKEPHIWELYSRGVREADLVIAPSRASAKELTNEGSPRVEIIPHGTEIPQVAPPLPESFAVGYLGQTGPDKGLIYLIRAWGTLAHESAPLFIAGDQSDQLAPMVTANANRGRFELLGRVPRADDLYQRISVYVQPSVTEGFGIEIIEAMAQGRPVIVSDGAGGADAVSHGTDGFVVRRRDPEAIADHLRWFSANPEKIVEMGAKAREKVKRYTWETVRRTYVEKWKGLLG